MRLIPLQHSPKVIRPIDTRFIKITLIRSIKLDLFVPNILILFRNNIMSQILIKPMELIILSTINYPLTISNIPKI